jgi:hypothetical protein
MIRIQHETLVLTIFYTISRIQYEPQQEINRLGLGDLTSLIKWVRL